jgi:hypothetical protein
MINYNFVKNNEVRLALASQTVAAAATAQGPWIPINTGKTPRVLTLLIACRDLASVTVLKIGIDGRTRGSDGSTPEVINDKDGNELVFTAAKTIDGAELEGGFLIGSIPLSKLPDTIDAIRVDVRTVTGGDAADIVGFWIGSHLTDGLAELNTDDFAAKVFNDIG